MRRQLHTGFFICIAVFHFGLMGTYGQEITNIWRGNVNSDWFNANNWSQGIIPANGHHIFVTNATGNKILLTNNTPMLAELVITNSMLTCSNWYTTIYATEIAIRMNGIVTMPGSFGTNEMSNMIHIVAFNLILDTGALINADSRGYKTGQGPGKGNGFNGTASGGGHGGKGADTGTSIGGATNDFADAPILPGSGGALYSADDGPGGGVIRFEATNIVVNGTISADGGSGATYAGGGAGGTIYINCSTFGGSTNGIVRARGGYGGSGNSNSGGGGGRIAIIYMNLSETIGVKFFAAPGARFIGGMGTLYLSDTTLVRQPFDNFQGVRLVIPGFNAWASESLMVSNSVVSFGDGDFILTVTNTVTIWSNSWLAVGGIALSGTQNMGVVSTLVTNPRVMVGTLNLAGGLTLGGMAQRSDVSMKISGHLNTIGGVLRLGGAAQTGLVVLTTASNVFLNGGSITLGGLAQVSNTVCNVGGNLTLTNGSALWIYSGLSNSATSNGALVSISGKSHITVNSWIYPISHPTNGGTPYFLFNDDLFIGEHAGFNAYGGGFHPGYGYGRGSNFSSTANSGGGYGGKGGMSSMYPGGVIYGSSNAPMIPGSGGGQYDLNGGYGGGFIWIDAKLVTLNGTLSANGGNGGVYNGGGSGGSILLGCDAFTGSSSSYLCATGGMKGSGYSTLGGGGGGRIAVWIGLPESIRALVKTGNLSRVTVDSTCKYFLGTYSLTNGTGYTNLPPGGAEAGTILFLVRPFQVGMACYVK